MLAERGGPGPLGGGESGEEREEREEKAGGRVQPLSCRGGDCGGVGIAVEVGGPGREPGTAMGVLGSENGAKPVGCSLAPSTTPASVVMGTQTRAKIAGSPGL